MSPAWPTPVIVCLVCGRAASGRRLPSALAAAFLRYVVLFPWLFIPYQISRFCFYHHGEENWMLLFALHVLFRLFVYVLQPLFAWHGMGRDRKEEWMGK